jgi:hypothetical protein
MSETGSFGENYASGELELRGWIVCLPTRDIEIDRVAFKIAEGQFKYIFIQVKTAIWTKKSKYTITVKKTKAYEDPHFVFIFVLKDFENRTEFLVLTTNDWKETMGDSLNTKSWKAQGRYTFRIPENLGKWKKHLNAYERLDAN